jgi:hypothetical protein
MTVAISCRVNEKSRRGGIPPTKGIRFSAGWKWELIKQNVGSLLVHDPNLGNIFYFMDE